MDLEEAYYLRWQDHTLDLAWGQRPVLLNGGRPFTQRQLAAYKNHIRRVSPLEEARRYKAELDRPGMGTKVEIARRFHVSRARVVQFLNLLTLDPRIVEFLDANFNDPIVAATITERRLRELLATTAPAEQWDRFCKILEHARSEPGIWATLAPHDPEKD